MTKGEVNVQALIYGLEADMGILLRVSSKLRLKIFTRNSVGATTGYYGLFFSQSEQSIPILWPIRRRYFKPVVTRNYGWTFEEVLLKLLLTRNSVSAVIIILNHFI